MASELPQSHKHTQDKCPVTGQTHGFCPSQPGDSRSPCPALNTLANHGYLPRNGENIGVFDVIRALKEGYHLSTTLAYILAFGGFYLLNQWGKISLGDLARHNHIEHDASLVHRDAAPDAEYAPCEVDDGLLQAFREEVKAMGPKLTMVHAAQVRVNRESQYKHILDNVHAEVARGELAIAVGVLGGPKSNTEGLDVDTLCYWLEHERLPEDWKPTHTQGLWRTFKMSKVMRDRMRKLWREQGMAQSAQKGAAEEGCSHDKTSTSTLSTSSSSQQTVVASLPDSKGTYTSEIQL